MFPVFENLRAFFNSRPPLVVFMICLASFAIALITFAYIVKTKDIPDSDVIEDWNTFLEKFSKIDLCFPQNVSEKVMLNATGGKLTSGDLSPLDLYTTLQEKFKDIDFSQFLQIHKIVARDVNPTTKAEAVGSVTNNVGSSSATTKSVTATESRGLQLRNVSFVLNVEVVLSKTKIPHIFWTGTQFITVISGDKLKLKGDVADAKMVATFTFPTNASSSTCQSWDRGMCTKHILLACVHLEAPASMLPNTPMPDSSEVCQAHHAAAIDTPGVVRFMVPTLPAAVPRMDVCQQGSRMSAYFSFDESLTVLLSLHDRSIINLRLMRTSYFLFVMVVTFFCYAMVKGRKSKNKTGHIPYVEKIPS